MADAGEPHKLGVLQKGPLLPGVRRRNASIVLRGLSSFTILHELMLQLHAAASCISDFHCVNLDVCCMMTAAATFACAVLVCLVTDIRMYQKLECATFHLRTI